MHEAVLSNSFSKTARLHAHEAVKKIVLLVKLSCAKRGLYLRLLIFLKGTRYASCWENPMRNPKQYVCQIVYNCISSYVSKYCVSKGIHVAVQGILLSWKKNAEVSKD